MKKVLPLALVVVLCVATASGQTWLTGSVDDALAVFGPSTVPKMGDDATLLNNYAWFWAQQGTNLESALAAVRRSIALDDRDWSEDTLAVVLLGLGRLDEALAAVNKAMAVSTTPSRYKGTEKKIKDAIEKKKQGK